MVDSLLLPFFMMKRSSPAPPLPRHYPDLKRFFLNTSLITWLLKKMCRSVNNVLNIIADLCFQLAHAVQDNCYFKKKEKYTGEKNSHVLNTYTINRYTDDSLSIDTARNFLLYTPYTSVDDPCISRTGIKSDNSFMCM